MFQVLVVLIHSTKMTNTNSKDITVCFYFLVSLIFFSLQQNSKQTKVHHRKQCENVSLFIGQIRLWREQQK